MGHWLAGVLASATVLSTSVVVSSVVRQGGSSDTPLAAGAEPSAADAVVTGDDGRHHQRIPESRTETDPEEHAEPRARRRAVRVGGGCDRPSRLLDLANWKLTLPTGSRSAPTEVVGRQLGSLGGGDWFSMGHGCEAVAFRAPVNGVTTSGSKNPRSELREMTSAGADKAGWSSTSGTHTMTVTQAFTRLPKGKPHVVGGQIHDAADDVAVFRLEGANLYVTNGDDPHYRLVTGNYVLGTPFEAKFVVSGGRVRAYYNGRLVATIDKAFSDAYFKAGAYTQANCQNASPCDSGNYGEVLIYDLKVSHT